MAPENIKIFVMISVLVGSVASACPKDILSSHGYRGVEIGMTLSEAEEKYGEPLKPYSEDGRSDENCFYVYPNGKPDAVGIMIYSGTVARVDIFNPGPATDKGISVGSSEKLVRDSYSDLTERDHPYGLDGDYYLTTAQKNGFQYVFETRQGVVSSFRAGRVEQTRLVEGCN